MSSLIAEQPAIGVREPMLADSELARCLRAPHYLFISKTRCSSRVSRESFKCTGVHSHLRPKVAAHQGLRLPADAFPQCSIGWQYSRTYELISTAPQQKQLRVCALQQQHLQRS